jgi:hypothetical protein
VAELSNRGRFDPVALLFGIGALLVAGIALTDGTSWLPDVDPRWLLACAALLLGVLLLANALRRPPERD